MQNTSPKIQEHKDFLILMRGDGFMPTNDPFSFIASFEVVRKKDNFISIFAFKEDLLTAFSNPNDSPLERATEEIKTRIDDRNIQHLEEYTYEIFSQNILEFENCSWWNKTLKNHSTYFQKN